MPLKGAEDPVARKFSWLPKFLANFLTRDGKLCLNRDGCRTPLQWDSSENAGFTDVGVETWLPLEPHYKEINVEIQETDPESMLSCYKKLLEIRMNTPALHSGSIQIKDLGKSHKDSVLAYERLYYTNDFQQIVQIVLNFSDAPQQLQGFEGQKTLLFSTRVDSNPLQDDSIRLEPLEGIVMKLQ